MSPYSLACSSVRNNDAVRPPTRQEIITLFHLLKNILPCSKDEDEFKRTCGQAEAAGLNFNDQMDKMNVDPEEGAAAAGTTPVFRLTDAQQKLCRAQVMSAYSLAEHYTIAEMMINPECAAMPAIAGPGLPVEALADSRTIDTDAVTNL